MKIAVLMTCHNRKDLTLRCLRSLSRAVEARRAAEGERRVEVDLFLTDDGSTDGTAEAVAGAGIGEFCVRILQGTGKDYWARGMERAWQAAVAGGTPYEAYLWLNDDTELVPTALSTILQCSDANPSAVVCGTLISSSGTISYGLNVALGLAGNCVLVPRCVYESVGMICGRYAHGWADYDYGLQAERAGFALVSAGVVGAAEGHEFRPPLRNLPLRERIGLLFDPKGWNVHDLWLLRMRNGNVFWALASCTHMIAHVLVGAR